MKLYNKSTIAENIKKYCNKLGIFQDRLSKLVDVAYKPLLRLNRAEYKAQLLIRSKKFPKRWALAWKI